MNDYAKMIYRIDYRGNLNPTSRLRQTKQFRKLKIAKLYFIRGVCALSKRGAVRQFTQNMNLCMYPQATLSK